jgi:hypothetical protein
MFNIDHILEEYQKADATKRQDLYLQYRFLRSDFDDIEKKEDTTNEMAPKQVVVSPAKVYDDVTKGVYFRKLWRRCCAFMNEKSNLPVDSAS